MDMASSVERICASWDAFTAVEFWIIFPLWEITCPATSKIAMVISKMRDQHYCYISLEYPFEEYPCFKVRQIIMSDDQLNQLITCDERENHTGYRHNRIVGHRLHLVEYTRREIRRACCYICSYTSNLALILSDVPVSRLISPSTIQSLSQEVICSNILSMQ